MAGRLGVALGVCLVVVTPSVGSLNAEDASSSPTVYGAPGVGAAAPAGPASLNLCTDASGKLGTLYWSKWLPSASKRNASAGPIVIEVDIGQTSCVAQPIALSVPNDQPVTAKISKTGDDDCKVTATETIVPVTAPDITAILAKFFTNIPTTGFGTQSMTVTPTAPQNVPLPPLANAKGTVTISCVNDNQNPKQMTVTKTIAVTYQNMPPVSASAGAIVSLLGKNTYGVNTTIGSVSSSGAVTPVYTVGVTSTSTIQLVPVAFLNTYLVGNRNLHFDLQSGMGINPNGSKTNVEYFFGPALAWHGLYLSPGLHIAQAQYLTSGFAVGQTVSSGSFTVPTVWKPTLRFGFSITYSPKVTSSASSAPAPAAN